jgi:ABC-type transport system involved in multi-copper enzyme maturation permease subunit
MLGLPQYLWRLIPANPILLRVVETGGKRTRDLVIRCIYLGLLVLLVLFSLGNVNTGNLSELSIQSTAIFNQLSVLQLLLVALLAPIFTAGAITQEKDSQTYDILLATPLTNGQIVFGSLFSRLFFVFALLVSGIPIFSITQVFGGVAIGDIVLSVLIAAATALITGSLAIAIATFKVGTRRTIFSFYLFNILYLVGLYMIDAVEGTWVPLDASVALASETRPISWLTPFHPFLALKTVLDPVHYVTPSITQLPAGLRFWPVSWMLTHPVGFYITFQTVLSFVLVLPSIVLLRRMAQSTSTLQQMLLGWLPIASKEKARKPRSVWSNPIAWREARTKASAARSVVLRYGFILLGLGAIITLIIGHSRESGTRVRYTDDGAYDAASSTVYLHGDAVGTYRVGPDTVVTIDNRPASLAEIGDRYDVANLSQATRQGSKYLLSLSLQTIPRAIPSDMVRQYLLGLVLVEVTAILLIITNAAASTVTREKEDGTLDLLLATPITSRYYIWGKIRGLISYVIPLLAVPLASCGIFILYDLFRWMGGSSLRDGWIVLPESLLLMPGMLVVVFAFASLVGMHMSLRCRTTVWAVMSSVGIMLAVCGILGYCGFALLNGGRFNESYVAISSFSPMTMLMMLIAPRETIGDQTMSANLEGSARGLLFVFSIVASCVYAAIVWSMYISMVKNFDMTIRKQSR